MSLRNPSLLVLLGICLGVRLDDFSSTSLLASELELSDKREDLKLELELELLEELELELLEELELELLEELELELKLDPLYACFFK